MNPHENFIVRKCMHCLHTKAMGAWTLHYNALYKAPLIIIIICARLS